MVSVSYIVSSVRQHKGLSVLMLIILLINNYVLMVFFGEFVRTDTQDWGQVQIRSESNMPFLFGQEDFEQILALYEEYEHAFSGFCRIRVEVASLDEIETGENIDLSKKKYMTAGYDVVKKEDTNFSVEELIKGKNVAKTKWANTGEEYTAFGQTFYAYHYESKVDAVPMQEVIQLQMPIYFVSCFCDGGSVNEVASFAHNLETIYPDAVIECGALDGRVQKEQKKIFLFGIMAIIATANIVFVYEYILQQKKKEIQIYRIVGCSKKGAMGMLLAEIQVYYIASFLGAYALYNYTYFWLYKWGLVSYKAKMEVNYLAEVFFVLDVVLLVMFGIFIIRFFWKNSLVDYLS